MSEIKGFIFDLDGVIVDTAHFHGECWKEMAERIGINLTQRDLDQMRGVGRMESLELILKNTEKAYSEEEKQELATSKNECYLNKVDQLNPADELPGIIEFMQAAKKAGLKISLGSSSKNAKLVLQKLQIERLFDAVCDGTDITRSKPDPQIFELACDKLGLTPQECVVFEDAEEGIKAALAAGCIVVGVGSIHSDSLQRSQLIIENFEATSPEEVLATLSTKKNYHIKYLSDDPWKIVETEFDASQSEVSESIFSIGNGFMGVRGNFEETYSGKSLQGSYYAGIYYPDKTRVGWWKNGYPEYFAKVLNGVQWIGCKITAAGESLDLANAKISNFKRVLDMSRGLLIRSFDWHTPSGTLTLIFERFCSFNNKHLGALEIDIASNDFEGIVSIQTGLDYEVWNRDSNYDEQFWEDFRSVHDESCMSISAKTKKTGFEVAASVMAKIEGVNWVVKEQTSDKYVGFRYSGRLHHNEEIRVHKFVAIQTSLYEQEDECIAATRKMVSRYAEIGYDHLEVGHKAAWQQKWEEVDIEIDGDLAAQQGIRFNIFQLLQTYRGDDPRLNIGPKGFTGEKYGGSTYWDTEAYCLPFYYHSCGPKVAKQLLMYRYNHLAKAIENAELLGFKNGAALYPMVTMNGEECHNEWEITFEEIHRNGAIVYAIFYYLQATGDTEYVDEYGLPVIIAVSRFWNQRMSLSKPKGKYVILGVTGPNEYENNVNNNWYTNKIAQWCLEFTIEQLNRLKDENPSKFSSVCKTHQIDAQEIDVWSEKAKNIFFPYDDSQGVFLQQDGFLDKELVPASSIPEGEYPIHKHWSWDRILRSCFIKQADVLQGLYIFEPNYDIDTIKRNFDFYEPMTVHESSLSPCIHSILAAKIGEIEKSYELYLRTARLDLDNYNHDTDDGLHITSMAGTWMSFVYGFAGARIHNKVLTLNPLIPKQWIKYSFKIIHLQSVIQVVVYKDKVKIQNLSSDGVHLNLYGEEIELLGDSLIEKEISSQSLV